MEIIIAFITGSLAIFGVIVGAKLTSDSSMEENEKNIVASLISSSRMQWIQDVRKNSAEFVAYVEDFHLLKIKRFRKRNNNQIDEELDRQLEKMEVSVFKSANILKLHFGFDKENDELLNQINQLLKMNPYEEIYRRDKTNISDVIALRFMDASEEVVDQFIKIMRLYLNKQWRRAKSLERGNVDPSEFESIDLDSYKKKYNIESIDVETYKSKGISL